MTENQKRLKGCLDKEKRGSLLQIPQWENVNMYSLKLEHFLRLQKNTAASSHEWNHEKVRTQGLGVVGGCCGQQAAPHRVPAGSRYPAASLALSDKSDISKVQEAESSDTCICLPKSVTAVNFSTKLYNCCDGSFNKLTNIHYPDYLLLVEILFSYVSSFPTSGPWKPSWSADIQLSEENLSLRKQEAVRQIPLPDHKCFFF